MKTFKVRYYECYEDYYEVEANSKEEAEELINTKYKERFRRNTIIPFPIRELIDER